MSGICGIVDKNGEPDREECLRRMLKAAPHRGADGVFTAESRNAAFGYLSLEITPESIGEVQPVVHRPTGVLAVASLRLDNRSELVAKLGEEAIERDRREFSGGASSPERSPTDAEMLLLAYLKWGVACCEHLLGDFALAIWDPRSQRLQLARDPMAMRPLYYRVRDGRIVFASEVKQILALPGVERRINETAVAEHLTSTNHSLGTTFYEGIDQLEAGRTLLISESGIETSAFWRIDPTARTRFRKERDYAEHLRELFSEAVACRMRSKKPVGISLSGGMDSGSVAAMAGLLGERGTLAPGGEFRSYSFAFSDPDLVGCDERENSGRITGRYGIPATGVPADDAWPLAGYPDHGPDEDEPYFGEFQCVLDRVLAAAGGDGVGLLLSGDRGDLLLGESITDLPQLLARGKPAAFYRELRLLQRRYGLLPTLKRRLLKPVVKDLLRHVLARAQPAHPAPGGRKPSCPPHLNERFIRAHEAPPPVDPCGGLRHRSARARCGAIFVPMHMKGMVWSERTNARHGIGFADPFSDRRLVEYILSIPQTVVSRLSAPKCLLRTAMNGVIPQEALLKAHKVSLEPFYHKGLRKEARGLVLDLFTGSELARRDYVNEAVLLERTHEFLDGSDLRFPIWPVLSLEMWLRRYWKGS